MLPLLSGQRNISQSMFGETAPTIRPDTDEMDKARERVMYKKHVQVKGYRVEIFDIHDTKQRKKYETLMGELLQGAQAMTHKIWVNEFELLNTSKGQRWHRYVEWSEFELQVEPTVPVSA